jgi:kinesin family member 15
VVGQPVVNNVMQGYNACCFAYGQTGAGKTHTMQGELAPLADGSPNDQRGFAPRVFEAIFQAIEAKEGELDASDAPGGGGDGVTALQFTCRCSFLQIYNEQISDLVKPGDRPLALRYDVSSGVYVENLSEHIVVNSALHAFVHVRSAEQIAIVLLAFCCM